MVPKKVGNAAKAVGKQVVNAAVMAKGIAVTSTKNVPLAAKNAAVHPQAAARSAATAVKTALVQNTVKLPGAVKSQGAGAALTRAAAVASGLGVPIAAVNG